jgi:four helix bundle protein
MMKDETFEKLEVWQRAIEVGARMHELLRDTRDFGYRDQITGSADSISANIAESAERITRREFRQFVGYAKGSAGETRSRLYIGRRLGYFTNADADALLDELRRISRMLNGLIESLDHS